MSWEREKEKLGKDIIGMLYKAGMIKTWYRDNPKGWTLVSGLWSPLYIQLRLLPSYPEILREVGNALGKLINKECPGVNRIVGVANTGIPIVTAISLETGIPSCFTRKLEGVKSPEDLGRFIGAYGEHSMVEGLFADGDNIGIVDDLATKFGSKIIALEQLRMELEKRGINAKCSEVIVLLDREQGATEAAKALGMNLLSLIPFESKGLDWLKDEFYPEEYRTLKDYFRDPEKYQNPVIQAELVDSAQSQR